MRKPRNANTADLKNNLSPYSTQQSITFTKALEPETQTIDKWEFMHLPYK